MTENEHEAFARIIHNHAGIHLGLNKRQLLSGRLQKRVRALGLDGYAAYLRFLNGNLQSEMGNFVNAITTNLTAFFRENHHFIDLHGYLQGVPGGHTVRIWSAGCSTGEEPYSIAMVVMESGAQQRGVSVQILASDIDTNCVTGASRGIYELDSVKGLSEKRMRANFLRGRGAKEGFIRVRDSLRQLIDFQTINLLGTWPSQLRFDLIFCRNVVIYFDAAGQRRLFDRFADVLTPDGRICIGHSENLMRSSSRYALLGNTTYQKIG